MPAPVWIPALAPLGRNDERNNGGFPCYAKGALMRQRRQGLLLNLIVRWVISTFAIYGVAWLLAPHIQVENFQSAIGAGLALGLINAVVRPIVVVLTLPVTVLSLGLFLLVVNAFMLWLVDELVAGFEVESFGWAILGSILISLISTLLNALARDR